LPAGLPTSSIPEVLLPEAAQRYGLWEGTKVGADGRVRPMEKPGLGAEIDFALSKRMEIGKLS